MHIQRLPDAELEIMKIVWLSNKAITSAQIMAALVGKKEWVLSTVLNFLSRLADRGFITIQRYGRANMYTPIISEERYLESESKSFLARLHGNSFKSLVAALYDGMAISDNDLRELKDFINEKAGDEL